jgi:hypothetical protein
VRVFFDNHNDFLLAQVPHGHVTTPLLDLATQILGRLYLGEVLDRDVAVRRVVLNAADVSESLTSRCVRVFFDNHNDFLLAQVPHGHVTTPLLDLATQPGSSPIVEAIC